MLEYTILQDVGSTYNKYPTGSNLEINLAISRPMVYDPYLDNHDNAIKFAKCTDSHQQMYTYILNAIVACLLEALAFLFTLAKLVFKYYAVRKAQQSFAFGYNPRLVSAYMQQLPANSGRRECTSTSAGYGKRRKARGAAASWVCVQG